MSKTMRELARAEGLRVREATKPMILTVNSVDVKRAQAKDASDCALSRATKRTHPEVEAAYFFRTTAWLRTGKEMIRYRLPASVQKEIVAFDRSGTMEPGNYRLSPVQPANSLDAHRKKPKAAKRSGKLNPKGTKPHRTDNVRGTFNPLV